MIPVAAQISTSTLKYQLGPSENKTNTKEVSTVVLTLLNTEWVNGPVASIDEAKRFSSFEKGPVDGNTRGSWDVQLPAHLANERET